MIDKRGNFHVRTGVVVFKNDFFPQVIDKLEFDLKSPEGKLKYENWPFLIFRSPSGTYKSQCSTNIKCWKDYLETQNPVGPAIDQFVQKYIIPKGSRHTDTYYAGFVRVVYHTRAVRIAEPHLIRHPMNRKRLKRKVGRDPIANYGFRIRNKIYEVLDDEAKGLLRTNTWNSKKKKGGPNLDRRGVVNTEEKNSFEVYKIQGESLSVYEKMCNKVVQFLQQSYSIRINRIVLDFITDSDNKVWLFNCKSLRIDDKVYMH